MQAAKGIHCMSHRILIFESTRDENTARREVQVKDNSLLRAYEFDHFYATEPAPLDQTRPMPARLMQSQEPWLDEKELLRRLTERVDVYKPDILVVHSGSMFHSFPDQMLFVLRSLKASHPDLRIGFQPRSFEKYGPKPYFEYTTEMGSLMAEIFLDKTR
jgi:hypothetical protein